MHCLREENHGLQRRVAELEAALASAMVKPTAEPKVISIEPIRPSLTPQSRRLGTLLAYSRAAVQYALPAFDDLVRVTSAHSQHYLVTL